jgi:BlaI family transcriptional regulator, penicillinase repressor
MEKNLPRPTDAELAILRVIWALGPSTVRDIHEEMLKSQPRLGYTTVLKLLQIMTDKGLVDRDESRRAHVYSGSASAESMQRMLVRDLADRAFGGSASQLVMRALSGRKASAKELAEIRALLDSLEGGRK